MDDPLLQFSASPYSYPLFAQPQAQAELVEVDDIEPETESADSEEHISLSRYFPKNTVFFYGFPSGHNSNFFNGVPPCVEELVAARPLVCAGENIRVIAFHATAGDRVRSLLEDECGVAMIDPKHIIILPKEIHTAVQGDTRNEMVKKSLKSLVAENQLIMAQPLLDAELNNRYRIPPELTIWLNDKKHMPQYVPAEFLPQRHMSFEHGPAFIAHTEAIALPCVVKFSSSSSGDGVRICKTEKDLEEAKKAFENMPSTIFIEECIEAEKNFCIQFGIPYDRSKPIEIIGLNEQVIDKKGEFLGGIVHASIALPVLNEIYRVLTEKILAAVRDLGWYGIGGIDVLIDKNGKFFFIDSNFRQTATFAFVCKAKNMKLKKSLISFVGSFTGTEEEFKQEVLFCAKEGSKNQLIQVVALSQNGNQYCFNAGILFDTPEMMKAIAVKLLQHGVDAHALKKIAES